MIQKALQYTNTVLSQFLKNKFDLDEDKVIINNIIDANGSIPIINQNKIIISLINIEKEALKPYYNRHRGSSEGSHPNIAPTQHYNLYVLMTSYFDDYNETLKFLNAIILFFQANPSLSDSKYSNVPIGLNKLDLVLEKIDYQQMHSLWSSIGAKYQPSVIYKARLISVQADEVYDYDPNISKVSNLVST